MNPPNSSRARGAGFKVAGLKRTRKCEAAGGEGRGGGGFRKHSFAENCECKSSKVGGKCLKINLFNAQLIRNTAIYIR